MNTTAFMANHPMLTAWLVFGFMVGCFFAYKIVALVCKTILALAAGQSKRQIQSEIPSTKKPRARPESDGKSKTPASKIVAKDSAESAQTGEVRAALLALGYKRVEFDDILRDLKPGQTPDLVKGAIVKLHQRSTVLS